MKTPLPIYIHPVPEQEAACAMCCAHTPDVPASVAGRGETVDAIYEVELGWADGRHLTSFRLCEKCLKTFAQLAEKAVTATKARIEVNKAVKAQLDELSQKFPTDKVVRVRSRVTKHVGTISEIARVGDCVGVFVKWDGDNIRGFVPHNLVDQTLCTINQ